MRAAPNGAFGAMAYTIGNFGIGSLVTLGKLMLCVYLTMAIFIFVILNAISRAYGFSLWRLLGYIRDEILIVLGTSSSEAVLPRLMGKLERFGCARSVVGLVVPAAIRSISTVRRSIFRWPRSSSRRRTASISRSASS